MDSWFIYPQERVEIMGEEHQTINSIAQQINHETKLLQLTCISCEDVIRIACIHQSQYTRSIMQIEDIKNTEINWSVHIWCTH